MMRWIDDLGYRLCWGNSWLAYQWSRVWYRYRCPYPVIEDRSARACVAAGCCGCNNGFRFPQESET
jgi:hypothetical protein